MAASTKSYYNVYVYKDNFHSTYQVNTLEALKRLLALLPPETIDGIHHHIETMTIIDKDTICSDT